MRVREREREEEREGERESELCCLENQKETWMKRNIERQILVSFSTLCLEQ